MASEPTLSTVNDIPCTTFSLASDTRAKDADGNYLPIFYRVTVWRRLAENVARYLGYYKYRGEEIENGVPAIITQELFDRVQARRARNRQSRAGAKAETEYLLTTKLYCGHCNSMMIGESGRSKNGSMYHYYKCGNHKRADGCHQRIFRKDVIEKLVIDRAIQLIHEDNVIDFVAECASRIQKQESTMLPVLEAQLREVQASIDNMIKAIEMGIITASTKERLEALEDDKKKLLSAIATEKMEHPDIPKKFFEYWLSRLVSGDIESPEYRKMIADIFINSIYVLDDGLKLGLNFSDGVDTIPLHQWNDAQCSDSLGYAPPQKMSENASFQTFFMLIFQKIRITPPFHCVEKGVASSDFTAGASASDER